MTFLWHDYETFGTVAAYDRPCQFAALRTDEQLEPLGDPVCLYAKPARDMLPHPMACLVTGITPQEAEREGTSEAEFATQIHALMTEPGTCGVGYNSLRFDDHVSRHLFYRNFFDPYAREWQHGNSRWDLINLTRMCYALRPQGLEWPEREAGVPSFRLEDLTAANGIEHAGAHDALVDVRATIALARRLRQAQPRLFQWALKLRKRAQVNELLDYQTPQIRVYSGPGIAGAQGSTTLVLPLAVRPERKNEILVADLAGDCRSLLEETPETLAARLFVRQEELAAGEERTPLRSIKVNEAPMLAPLNTLQGVDLDRIALNRAHCEQQAQLLLQHFAAAQRSARAVYQPDTGIPVPTDPDAQLYGGPFFSKQDQQGMRRLRRLGPADLADHGIPFEDQRMDEMIFRYRARNWPDSLSESEAVRWEQDRLARLKSELPEERLNLRRFRAAIQEARAAHEANPQAQQLLDEVAAWGVLVGD